MAGSTAHVGDSLTIDSSGAFEPFETNIAPSPTSGNSSDTLHDNESFDNDHKRSTPSATPLNFDGLSIQEDRRSYSQRDASRNASHFHYNVKNHIASPLTYGHHVQPFRRSNYHMGFGNGFQRGGHRNTSTRVSDEVRTAQEFLIIRNSMKRLFKNADVAKWKVADYIAHREALATSRAKKLAHAKDNEVALCIAPISLQQQEMMRRCGLNGNFDQVGNRSLALGEKTIWCKDWQNGKDEIAPWPCLAEQKWEGDDRAKTGVGRYPPLPREQGPVGLQWSQLQVVEQYPLDQIACIPTMEDVYLPVDEIDEHVKCDLLDKSLEDAMDAYLES